MTRPSRRLRELDDSVELIDRARTRFDDAVTRIMAARPGYPSATNPDSPGGGGATSPTEANVIARTTSHGAGVRRDQAVVDLGQLDGHLRALHRAAHQLVRIVEHWAPRYPNVRDQRDTELANVPACTPCAAHGFHAPLHIHSDAKGNLDHPLALCSWHYRWTLDTGTLPTGEQVTAHHEGRKIRRPA